MNDFLSNYALFLAEAVTVVVAILAVVAGLVLLSRRKARHAGHVEVSDVNRQLEAAGDTIEALRLPKKAHKTLLKRRKAEHKTRLEQAEAQACTYLIDFKGDIRASAEIGRAHV